MAIPPAWRGVWICSDPYGHIQATGLDEAGRKQYLYHERWQLRAAQRKFESMREFAATLPRLRRRRSGPDDLLAFREDGGWKDVRSEDVNTYLQEKAGEDVSAKDFRTWHGTVLAAVELARQGAPRSKGAAERAIRAAVKRVAERLGNTPAICRSSYIDPRVLDRFRDGKRFEPAMNTLQRMRRPSLLASATALVLLLVAAAAPAASPETGTIVNVELGLKASNGLRAQLETSDDETVTLELRRKDRLVSYEVQGEVTKEGLKVRFGRLGLIDVAFTPTRTLSSTEPSEECTGEPRTLREGTFTGTIDFTGERNYVRIKAPQVEGSMSVISQWQCPEELALFTRTARPLAQSSRSEEKAASLVAFGRRCNCYFSAGVHFGKRKARSVFYGVKAEQREGMEIVRALAAHAGASAFVFDHAAGTATVRPPRPFRGRATFKRRSGERPLWRSTIRMPFLGVAPIKTQGPDFLVSLDPGYYFD